MGINLAAVLYLVISLAAVCSCTSKPLERSAEQLRTPDSRISSEVPPPPIVTVGGNAFYTDEHHSIVDEELYKKNEEVRKPLRNYLDKILKMTDVAQKGDAAAGIMIDKWLASWADGQALTKVDSQAGGFERKWILSGLLIAYWRNSPHSQWQNTQKIEKWLNQLTHLMMEDYQDYKKGSQKNNHVYWAGLVAIEMATINSDKKLFDWGLEKVRFGISQVDRDGFLPLELDRKGKALRYHRVSLEAFMMAAYFAKFQGVDLLSEKNSALNRLALTVLKGYENPDLFADKVGAKQDFKLKESTAWLAIYDFLQPGNLQVKKLLTEYPPVWARTLGGNVPNVLNSKR